jgi:RNA polymerase sigma-70 factor (sigma-E family)
MGVRDQEAATSKTDEVGAYAAARWLPLVRAARLLGCTEHEAEDLVQATLVKCFVSWSKVSRADDREAYVYRILINTHRANLRKQSSTEVPVAAPDASATVDFDTTGLATSIERALAALSPEARLIVVLRYFADLTERQTAEALGVPVGTVKSRAARALAQLSTDANLTDHKWSP